MQAVTEECTAPVVVFRHTLLKEVMKGTVEVGIHQIFRQVAEPLSLKVPGAMPGIYVVDPAARTRTRSSCPTIAYVFGELGQVLPETMLWGRLRPVVCGLDKK